MKEVYLGEFEQLVLLAILRLATSGAYGVSISREIAAHTKRKPSPGAIYTTLARLEQKQLIRSSLGEATPERGGRAKRYYEITARGTRALMRASDEFDRLAAGIPLFGARHA